jgi:hypothetical protein
MIISPICHGADLARDHNPAISPPHPWTWTTTSLYLRPNPGSQTHPQDACTDVSSSRNPDIWTLLDPDFGYPVLLRIPSSDSDQISGNLGTYDNCSPVSFLPCSYPPSPLTSVHVPMPPDCIPHSNCTCIMSPRLLDTSSDGFPFHHSSLSASRSLAIPFGLLHVALPVHVPACDTCITAVDLGLMPFRYLV